VTNCLVSNYSMTKNRACMDQLHNTHLNRIFEVAGVKYLPRSESTSRRSKKRKIAAAWEAQVIQDKTKGMKKWRRVLSQAEDKIYDTELMLPKPLKPSK
jgi:hypothetical protein